MKTTELVKRIEQFKLKYRFEDDSIVIVDECDQDWICIDFISESCVGFSTFEDMYIPSKYFDFLNVIVEYCNTPLEEREDEKKYYLRFPIGFNQILTYLGLSMRGYDCVGFDSSELYKKQFTQQEIDAMPFDTKFFIKVEVK